MIPPRFERGRVIRADDLNDVSRAAHARVISGNLGVSRTGGALLLRMLTGNPVFRQGRVVAVVGPDIGTQSQISYDCEIFGLPSTRAVRVPALGRHFDDDNLPLIRASQPEDPCIFVDLPDGEGGVERLLWIINERVITTQCQGTP